MRAVLRGVGFFSLPANCLVRHLVGGGGPFSSLFFTSLHSLHMRAQSISKSVRERGSICRKRTHIHTHPHPHTNTKRLLIPAQPLPWFITYRILPISLQLDPQGCRDQVTAAGAPFLILVVVGQRHNNERQEGRPTTMSGSHNKKPCRFTALLTLPPLFSFSCTCLRLPLLSSILPLFFLSCVLLLFVVVPFYLASHW